MRTYADLIDHISRTVWGYGVSASSDQIRTAIGSAYAALPLCGPWRRYEAKYRLITQTAQSGTLTVTDNGTAVVLQDGSWPAWAERSTILVGGTPSRIASIVSSTKAALTDPVPTIDSSPLNYSLFNDYHVLPLDFLSVLLVQLLNPVGIELLPTRPHTLLRQYGMIAYCGTPQWYSLEKGALTGLRLFPPPQGSTIVEVYYRRRLLPLTHTGFQEQHCQGTVSVSGTTVIGTNTAFTPDMEDGVIRIGTATTLPDGPDGYHPYQDEQLIASVVSETELTTAAPFASNWSGVRYRITDVLDVDEHLYQLLVTLSLAELAKMVNVPIRVDVDTAIRQARSADAYQMGPIPLYRPAPNRVSGKLWIDVVP